MDLKSLLNESKKVAVVVAGDFEKDVFFAATALVGVVRDMGKEVTLVSFSEVPDEASSYAFFQHDLGPRNLVISFDYAPSSIEKVRYFSEEGTFNLVLSPIPSDFKPENVRFSYTLPNFDLWVVFGAKSELELVSKDEDYKEEVLNSRVVAVASETPTFGDVRLALGDGGYCGLLFLELGKMGIVPSREASKALLQGMGGVV